MPEICRFFGVIIRMYWEPDAPHNSAHFHAYYQGVAAVFSIDPVELIAGDLPRRQCRLVEAWAELHKEELMQDWRLVESKNIPNPIQPLQ
jgi:hypothetical protein